MKAWLVLHKDVLVLRRSPVLVALLLAYPLLVAVLVGLVAAYAGARPRVALVDRDGLPERLVLAGRTFDIERTIERAGREVELLRLGPEDARRRLETGGVVATLTVPRGFVADLRSMARSPRLVLETTRGGLAPRVTREVQALVFRLNRELSAAYVEANLDYVRLLLDGGSGEFLGRRFEVLGLRETERLLAELPRGERLDRVRSFVRTAELALAETDDALRATANPIVLEEAPGRGRTWALSAQVQAYALALTLTFVCLLLAAAALAGERDERTVGRLARGPVRWRDLLAAKAALAASVALALGLAIAVAFGLAIELGGVEGGSPWTRMPLLAAGLALAGGCLGALGALLGALGRDARSASLAALLVALPIVFVGLVPREAVPAAGAVSDAFPFAHVVRLLDLSLYELEPARGFVREAAWLAGLGAVYAAGARLAVRRLLQ